MPDPGAMHHPQSMHASLLIVDDHADFRRAVRAMLEADAFTVVGEAALGAEAIAMAEVLLPDVVLLDVQLPDLDGFTVARVIGQWPDPPAVVLVSGRDARAYRDQLLTTSARGFIPKHRLSGAALRSLVHSTG